MPLRTRYTITALLTAPLLALSACGSTGTKKAEDGVEVKTTPLAQVTASPNAASTSINITVAGKTITPNGDRVNVKTGQPIVLSIDADSPGELHVHSTPEQHISYPSGKSQTTLAFDQPGVIDIESHTLDKLVVQLEVR